MLRNTVFVIKLFFWVGVCWEFDRKSRALIECNGGRMRHAYFNISIYYSAVELEACVINTTYADFFKLIGLNLPKELKIKFDEANYVQNTLMNATKFKGLDLESLEVLFSGPISGNQFNLKVLKILTKLKKFQLYGATLGPLPEENKITDLHLFDSYSEGQFGACQHLERLTLQMWDTKNIFGRAWLSRCTKLYSLIIKDMIFCPRIGTAVLLDAKTLTEVQIDNCKMKNRQDLFLLGNKPNLTKLSLTYNNIKALAWYDFIPSLSDIDLSYNSVENFMGLVTLFRKNNKTLVNFSFAGNRLKTLCTVFKPLEFYDMKFKFMYGSNKFNNLQKFVPQLPVLRTLSLADTALTSFCFKDLLAESLEFFDLSGNEFTILQFDGLPLSTAKRLKEVKLERTTINDVEFSKSHFDMLTRREEVKITGVKLHLKCDCNYAWLAYAIKTRRVALTAFCDKEPLEKTPNSSIACDKYACDNCTCRRYWEDETVIAHCGSSQTRIPPVEHLVELHASGNLIANFNATDVPNSLMVMDLTKNHISKLNPTTVEELFKVKGRSIYLAGNPVACDCDSVTFLTALQNHQTQIKDYDKVSCLNDNRRFLDSLDLAELCVDIEDAQIWIITSVLFGVVIALSTTATVFYKYERQIKIFLYARGFFHSCLEEKELEDRPYDAFVSFAHEDDEFVMQALMPVLEECGYKLCIHYRDWYPGEWIPAQISRSVQLSRRTIIVLSKNFLASVWGLLEFRLAYASMCEDNMPRIIILMLEDVTGEEMSEELKGYLKTNTYVKWGDRWFWDKLKYALPHQISKNKQNTELETQNPEYDETSFQYVGN